MTVQAVQKEGFDTWSQVQPYIVPGAVVTGISIVVNHVWGKVAAVAFLGIVAGVGVSFPHIIREFAEDSFYLNIARHVVIIVLPFFGTYGIYGSIGIATLTALAKDFRLYNMRGQLDNINTTIAKSNEKLKDEIKTAKERMQQFREKHVEIDTKLERLKSVDKTMTRVDAHLDKLMKTKKALDAILKEHEAESQVRLKDTAEIKSDILNIQQRVEEIVRQFQGFNELVTEALAETSDVNHKMQQKTR